MMPRWNRPFAEGMARSVFTFPPPPDWPKMVTLAGSPPKRPMFSFTHSSERTMSSWPTLPESLYFSPYCERSR